MGKGHYVLANLPIKLHTARIWNLHFLHLVRQFSKTKLLENRDLVNHKTFPFIYAFLYMQPPLHV